MKTIDAVRRSGVGVAPDVTIQHAAQLMTQAGVGTLAVTEGEKLLGIVTDRDIVRRGVAGGLAPDGRIDAIMSSPVLTIRADDDLHDAFAMFRTSAVRRLAVVRDGGFVGMITVDDLLIDLASDLTDLARPITAEAIFAHHDAAVPAPA